MIKYIYLSIIFCVIFSNQIEAAEKIYFLKKNDEPHFYSRLFQIIQRKNLCLITNQSGTGKFLFVSAENGNPTYFHQMLQKHGMKLHKVFSPEHGISSQSESDGTETDAMLIGNISVLPAYYKTYQELAVMYDGCDALLYDLPDAGVRPYTYRTILTRTIQAVDKMNFKPIIYMIDQANPASIYQPLAPMATEEYFSYLGEDTIPFFPYYTYAELLRRYISKNKLNVQIRYLAMSGYRPGMNLANKTIISPSPSLPHARALQCYWIGVFLEGTSLDFGKHTKDPFCQVGHPDINYEITPPVIPGLVWNKYVYKPFAGPYQGRLLRGYKIEIQDIAQVHPVKTAYLILEFFIKRYPQLNLFTFGKTNFTLDKLVGTNSFRTALEKKISYEKWEEQESRKISRFISEMYNYRIY